MKMIERIFVLNLLFTAPLLAQSSAFTYQGQLNDSGGPASGIYDFSYAIYDGPAITNGNYLLGDEITGVAVSNGLFTLNLLAEHWVFNGEQRWLEIQVRPNGPGAYTGLEPWTEITPTPYAVRALTVATNALEGGYGGVVSFPNPENVFVGDGSGLTDVTLDGLTASDVWQLGGNAGTTAGADFMGTSDNQALEFKVNGGRALRLEPTAGQPNVIGGSYINTVGEGGRGSFIGGGHWIVIGANADFSAIGGGYRNTIETNSTFGAIGGGRLNTINSYISTIGGGYHNTIEANSAYSTIAGGFTNTILANSPYAVIPGGAENFVGEGASNAFAAGHRAKANHPGTFVWGDWRNAYVSSTTNNQVVFRAQHGLRLTEDAGTSYPITIGDRYRDNAILAWGKVNTSGGLLAGFGVVSVSRLGVGQYEIVVTDTAADIQSLIPVAMPEIDAPPTSASTVRIISINQISTAANTFRVYINNGSWALVDNEFVFMVTAR